MKNKKLKKGKKMNVQKEVCKMMKDENIDWGHVGSLNHVRNELQETLDFLRGKSK